MRFGLVQAWNKRRRSKSEDYINPWIYKPVELWTMEYQYPQTKRRNSSQVFTQREMEEATNGFGEQNVVGKGGFGKVYRGTLRSGEVVAIKKMELPPFKVAQGEREFRVEVDLLSRLSHGNLVTFIGYCADGKQRYLVYEYMPRGNLQDNLNGTGHAKMDWALRIKVALGAARGLAYLHSCSHLGSPIIHRDFKSSNILLDENYDAKISDFGLAKLMLDGQETCATSTVLGTFGYFDPEYTLTGKLSLQSDVYAFGVVLLELLTGRRAVDQNDKNLVLQVRHILNDKKKLRKVIDPEMPWHSYMMDSIIAFAKLASRCVRVDSLERPIMEECVQELRFISTFTSEGLGGLRMT